MCYFSGGSDCKTATSAFLLILCRHASSASMWSSLLRKATIMRRSSRRRARGRNMCARRARSSRASAARGQIGGETLGEVRGSDSAEGRGVCMRSSSCRRAKGQGTCARRASEGIAFDATVNVLLVFDLEAAQEHFTVSASTWGRVDSLAAAAAGRADLCWKMPKHNFAWVGGACAIGAVARLASMIRLWALDE